MQFTGLRSLFCLGCVAGGQTILLYSLMCNDNEVYSIIGHVADVLVRGPREHLGGRGERTQYYVAGFNIETDQCSSNQNVIAGN